MSGPIVRVGARPEYWANWDQVFGDKKKAAKKKASGKASKKAPKKKGRKKS